MDFKVGDRVEYIKQGERYVGIITSILTELEGYELDGNYWTNSENMFPFSRKQVFDENF